MEGSNAFLDWSEIRMDILSEMEGSNAFLDWSEIRMWTWTLSEMEYSDASSDWSEIRCELWHSFWTGSQYVSSTWGEIKYEHEHSFLVGEQWCVFSLKLRKDINLDTLLELEDSDTCLDWSEIKMWTWTLFLEDSDMFGLKWD